MTETTTSESQDQHGGGTESLASIFHANAQRTPDALALVDPMDRAAFTRSPPRRLTYQAADRVIDTIAARLDELGLQHGARIALHLPNTIEAVLTLLAVQRAGLTPVLLPLAWSSPTCIAALTAVNPKALVTSDARIGGERLCDRALQFAVETFSIRFVCGFGRDLPDGIVPLDDAFDATSDARAVAGDSDCAALMTFAEALQAPLPTERTAAELLVSGLAVVVEAEIPRSATILGTMLLSSSAAVSCTLMPWLITGGTLALHQPFDPQALAAQMQDLRSDTLIAPGAVAADVLAACAPARPQRMIALWRAPEKQPVAPRWTADLPLTDVLAFGETGIVALRREADGAPRAIPAGSIKAPTLAARGTLVLTSSCTAEGTLAFGGPMVPISDLTTSESGGRRFADTRYPCAFDPAANTYRITGPQRERADPATDSSRQVHAPAA